MIRPRCSTRKFCYRKGDRAMRPIYRCPENFLDFLSTPIQARLFFPFFSWAFVPIDPVIVNMRTKFEVCSFARSWDNRWLEFRVGVANLQFREGGGRRGSGMGGWYFSKERWRVPIAPSPHSNFYSVFTRFRDIADFVLRDATFSYPTSSVPKISPYSRGNR